jgi:hypothetical protein
MPKALILVGGFGTRLRPLTLVRAGKWGCGRRTAGGRERGRNWGVAARTKARPPWPLAPPARRRAPGPARTNWAPTRHRRGEWPPGEAGHACKWMPATRTPPPHSRLLSSSFFFPFPRTDGPQAHRRLCEQAHDHPPDRGAQGGLGGRGGRGVCERSRCLAWGCGGGVCVAWGRAAGAGGLPLLAPRGVLSPAARRFGGGRCPPLGSPRRRPGAAPPCAPRSPPIRVPPGSQEAGPPPPGWWIGRRWRRVPPPRLFFFFLTLSCTRARAHALTSLALSLSLQHTGPQGGRRGRGRPCHQLPAQGEECWRSERGGARALPVANWGRAKRGKQGGAPS